MKQVYQRVEAVRKEKGISMSHIAEHCGHTVSWYSAIARGRRQMRVNDLEKIAEAMQENAGIFFPIKLSDTLSYESA